MRKIYRYELPITDAPHLRLPRGAWVLSVGTPRTPSQAYVDLWARVDADAPLELRAFRVVGTGNPVPDDCARFVGTVPTHGGATIWHVFEAAS